LSPLIEPPAGLTWRWVDVEFLENKTASSLVAFSSDWLSKLMFFISVHTAVRQNVCSCCV